jgi:MoaA/NifB/PqqE/SkfB family radical SAM enzyme
MRFKSYIEHQFLMLKIFLSVSPLSLYFRIIINAIKNDILRLYSPSSAVIGLTYRCQCKCVHCSASLYKKDIDGELTLAEIKKLLNEIKSLGVPRINLSGGEALLRKDIFQVIKYAHNKFVTVLETNGQLLDEERAMELKADGISCVAVSVDSYKPEIHDRLRNLSGCFKKAIRGISNCLKNKVPCLISTYIPSERNNPDDINGMMILARELKVLAVRIIPPRPVGSFSCHTSSLLNNGQEQCLIRDIDHSIAYFKGIPAPKNCGIFTKSTFYISPYGEVQPCAFLPLSFGNIRKRPLRVILNEMWGHEIFKFPDRNCLILNNEFRKRYIPEEKNNLFPIEILK